MDFVSSCRGRPRRSEGLRTPVSVTSSRTCSRACCRRWRHRGGALEVALLVEDPDTGSDPRTLGVAVRSALETLAAETPVVLAIDDIQWLDPSSASVLTLR